MRGSGKERGRMAKGRKRFAGGGRPGEASRERLPEEALKKAQRVARVGSWAWHIRPSRLEWSDEMHRIFGISKKAFTGDLRDVIRRAVHPDDRARVEQANRSVRRERKPIPLEYRVVWPDGTVRVVWAEAGELILDEAGNPAVLTGIVQDITERKRAEKALVESEKKYRALVENLNEGIWQIDKDGHTAFVNSRMARMLGYSPEKMLGKHLFAFMDEQGRIAAERNLKRRRQGVKEQHEFEFLRKDGSRLFALLETGPIFDEHGGYAGSVAGVQDITERKQTEARMRAFSRELLAAREDEKKRVSSVLHHDIGSLAVGLSAHFDAIEEDVRSGKFMKALGWVKRARTVFVQTVARLKGLAVELRPPDLDILGLRAALRHHFAQVTERGGIRIHFTETLGKRRMSGDVSTILFRVAQEALTNAIQHGHARKVDVSLEASKKAVHLAVRDNGRGFDPSGRGARGDSRMGLRVMQEMAASAGGALTVDSGQGKGARVCVSLPLEAATGSRA